MTQSKTPPLYDDAGINLADPRDRLGYKTEYISRLQTMALSLYLEPNDGPALDIGCGYGRMTQRLEVLGYDISGMDPSVRVLRHARTCAPRIGWFAGALPGVPCPDETFDTIFLLNVIRALHLMGIKDACRGIGRLLSRGGRLAIIDNLRVADSRYFDEGWLIEHFNSQGLSLKRRVPIRASRWFMIYLIRYGLVPRRVWDSIAWWELKRMANKQSPPRFSYHNVLWVFERK